MTYPKRFDIAVVSKAPGIWHLTCSPHVPTDAAAPTATLAASLPESASPAPYQESTYEAVQAAPYPPQLGKTLTSEQREAIQLLREVGGKRCDPWVFAGDRYAEQRQHLMLLLTGKQLPKSKCGIGVIQKEFYALMPESYESSTLGTDLARFQEWMQSLEKDTQ